VPSELRRLSQTEQLLRDISSLPAEYQHRLLSAVSRLVSTYAHIADSEEIMRRNRVAIPIARRSARPPCVKLLR